MCERDTFTSAFSSVSFSALDDNLKEIEQDPSSIFINDSDLEAKKRTHFIGLAFLIESIFVDDDPPPPFQENDIKTSPKHKFGSNPDSADSGWFNLYTEQKFNFKFIGEKDNRVEITYKSGMSGGFNVYLLMKCANVESLHSYKTFWIGMFK